MNPIPLVDLKAQYQSIKLEIDNAIQTVINETAFIKGKYVVAFEKAYAEKYGVKNCISCGNGTDALFIILKSLGIGVGDEVITTAQSWIATSEVITQAGARVVFADIEPEYYTIDPEQIEKKITPRTKAIIIVHLYGQSAEMETIKKICDKNGIHLIEDCAQAHFATYQGQKVGTFGIAGAFSFFPGKNLGAYGDAGAILTQDDALAIRMRRFACHGALGKHDHEIEGINSRMDGLQAAILSVKLKYIEQWTKARQEKAQIYNQELSNIKGIRIPKTRPETQHVFHLYVIRCERRKELMDFLQTNGISTGVHYPVALPFLKAYEYLGHSPKDFSEAYRAQNEILSLPLYPELDHSSIVFISQKIKEFFNGTK